MVIAGTANDRKLQEFKFGRAKLMVNIYPVVRSSSREFHDGEKRVSFGIYASRYLKPT